MKKKLLSLIMITTIFSTVGIGSRVVYASPQDDIKTLNEKIEVLKKELKDVNNILKEKEDDLEDTISEITKREKVIKNVDSTIEKTEERITKDIHTLAEQLSTKIIKTKTDSLLSVNNEFSKINSHPLSFSFDTTFENAVLSETKKELELENTELEEKKKEKSNVTNEYQKQKDTIEKNIKKLENEVKSIEREIERKRIEKERSERLRQKYGLSISGEGAAIVETALKYLGVPYVWGGTTPGGFDCSGLMQYAYGQHGKYISRTTYTQIYDGKPVSRSELQPGDLVFPHPDHVVMYIGNGKVVHAPQTGDVVKISPLGNVWKAVRIL